jgi:hypothetical protein
MKALPPFKKRPYDATHDYIKTVLTAHHADDSFLHELVAYDDGHYRATFDLRYFVLAAGHTEPSRSQWNGLKKKMKRHHRGVFVFKEHGILDSVDNPPVGYVDFGFFAS